MISKGLMADEWKNIDPKIQEEVESYIENWNQEDLVELLAECEFLLNNNEVQIAKLDKRGLPKLWNMISGIEKTSKKELRHNIQRLHWISLQVQKIILKRINVTQEMVFSLNEKVNESISFTQAQLIILFQKVLEYQRLEERINFVEWKSDIKYHCAADGKQYQRLTTGRKILQIVSDMYYFQNMDIPCKLSSKHKILDKLGINCKMRCREFLSDVADEKEICLSLFIKEELNYENSELSLFGKKLYELFWMYNEERFQKIMDRMGKDIKDVWLPVDDEELNREYDCMEICNDLLNDLDILHQEYMEVEEAEKLVEEQPEVMPEAMTEAKKDEQIPVSLVKISFDGSEKLTSGSQEFEKMPDFPAPEDRVKIKRKLAILEPYVTVVPFIKDSNGDSYRELTKYSISLADYYMYLWFMNTPINGRKGQRVLILEMFKPKGYNWHIYVSGYAVEASGDVYRRVISPEDISEMHWNRTRYHIVKDIKETGAFPDADWNEMLKNESLTDFEVYTVFREGEDWTDARKKRYKDLGFQPVDDNWEKKLLGGNDLKQILDDMIEKTKLADYK